MQAVLAIFPLIFSWALGLDISSLGPGQPLIGVIAGKEIRYLVKSDLTFDIVLNTENQSVKALEFVTNTYAGLVSRDLSPVIIRIFHIFPKKNEDEWIKRASLHDWAILDDRTSTGFKRKTFNPGQLLDMTPFLTLGNFFLIRGFFALHSIVAHLGDDTENAESQPSQESDSTHSEPEPGAVEESEDAIGAATSFAKIVWVLMTVIALSTITLVSGIILRRRKSKAAALLRDVEYKMVDLHNTYLNFVLVGGYRKTPDSIFDRFLLAAYDDERNCLVPVCIVGPELSSKDIRDLNDTIRQSENSSIYSIDNFQKPDVLFSSNRVWTFNSDEVIAEAENQLPIRLVSPRLIHHELSKDLNQELSQVRLILDRARTRYHVD